MDLVGSTHQSHHPFINSSDTITMLHLTLPESVFISKVYKLISKLIKAIISLLRDEWMYSFTNLPFLQNM